MPKLILKPEIKEMLQNLQTFNLQTFAKVCKSFQKLAKTSQIYRVVIPWVTGHNSWNFDRM